MAKSKFQFELNAELVRRLKARAALLGVDPSQVAEDLLAGWLGSWGQRSVTHIVQPGETLQSIAARYYGDSSKASVISAFNGITDPTILFPGFELQIPEPSATEPTPKPTPEPLPAGESPYIFGLHDAGGEHLMGWAGRRGWVLVTEGIGAEAFDQGSASYADLCDAGYGVIVRLNNGYQPVGTLPSVGRYGDFASRCGNWVEGSRGCHIWIIGNEPNLAVERPGGPMYGQAITPDAYAKAFALCRKQIRSRRGHEKDQVVAAAVGPWNVDTQYPGNPSGDWIVYFTDMLEGLKGACDGIAIHTYARGDDPRGISSEAHMAAPFDHRRSMFRTYIDFVEAIPGEMRHLPIYLTEANQNQPWTRANTGWVRAAYAEINRWNSDPLHQSIRCMLLYRWLAHDQWSLQDNAAVLDDFRAALQNDYRWDR